MRAPGAANVSPAKDGAWDANGNRDNQPANGAASPRSALDNDQMPLPVEPTAAGPDSGRYGGYDPARESWIPYTSSGYIGISGGKPDLNTACVAGLRCDDPDSAWSVFLGGQFNPYLGLQLGYLQLQDADRNGGDTKVRGVNIVLTGALPLGSNFSLNGRLGGTYGWTKTSVGAGVPAPSGNEEGFGASYGVGASWDFDRHWSVTLDWDRHHLKYAGDEKKDTDIASVGLRYRF
ncbi:MAG TPA: porin family protein [Candidatus Aquabacterium excrementipullorum]|nr:porin family protein [Candidatus Aquabacterium excrementipullorum]